MASRVQIRGGDSTASPSHLALLEEESDDVFTEKTPSFSEISLIKKRKTEQRRKTLLLYNAFGQNLANADESLTEFFSPLILSPKDFCSPSLEPSVFFSPLCSPLLQVSSGLQVSQQHYYKCLLWVGLVLRSKLRSWQTLQTCASSSEPCFYAALSFWTHHSLQAKTQASTKVQALFRAKKSLQILAALRRSSGDKPQSRRKAIPGPNTPALTRLTLNNTKNNSGYQRTTFKYKVVVNDFPRPSLCYDFENKTHKRPQVTDSVASSRTKIQWNQNLVSCSETEDKALQTSVISEALPRKSNLRPIPPLLPKPDSPPCKKQIVKVKRFLYQDDPMKRKRELLNSCKSQRLGAKRKNGSWTETNYRCIKKNKP